MKNVFKLFTCLAVIGLAFTSCSTDDSKEGAGFSVKLVDAPGDYEKVLVDVQAIEVILDGEAHELPVAEPGVYDLLELTGGVSAMLVETVLPAGKMSQMRLILGEENSVVANGDTLELKTPSAQQSGLKLNVHQELQSGILYNFILDFNVAKSVVEAPGEGLILKPVLRAALEAQSGAISGVVTPAEVESLVTAKQDSLEISAHTAPDTGAFLLYGVPAGTYQVTVTPDSTSGFSPVIIEDVVVQKGTIKDLGSVSLE
ncbi:DUF4382 domain-containing protein [Salinimicrobium catena]|uniref:DUF4382 domain-containing protein n=1 Tax=Salinimicrobium catena TaxID=390640 RepID=UPI002FE4A93C